jgi:sec-independent protein translocase protein TatA
MLTLGFGFPGHMEWVILLVIGLLLFGKRLPEVGRSVGRSIVEFKKGIKGIEDEIDTASSSTKQPDRQIGEDTSTQIPTSPPTDASKSKPSEGEQPSAM